MNWQPPTEICKVKLIMFLSKLRVYPRGKVDIQAIATDGKTFMDPETSSIYIVSQGHVVKLGTS